jgi:hypothetical protein
MFLSGFRIKRISPLQTHLKIPTPERIPFLPIRVCAKTVRKGRPVSIRNPREEFGVARNIGREKFFKEGVS